MRAVLDGLVVGQPKGTRLPEVSTEKEELPQATESPRSFKPMAVAASGSLAKEVGRQPVGSTGGKPKVLRCIPFKAPPGPWVPHSAPPSARTVVSELLARLP